MGSTFSGFSIATSGLYASQLALNTTSHNVSNADTAGYVRQQAMHVDKAYYKNGNFSSGTGVAIDEIRQIRSVFLDNMYRKEESSLSYWNIRQSNVEEIEAVMDDLSDDGGIKTAIDEFFSSWEEVSKDPSDGSARASLMAYSNNLVELINQFNDQLGEIQDNLNTQIVSMVKDINSISEQVVDLNGKIAISEVNGDNANDYRDEVNSLLDTLSEYVNISVTTDSDGMYNVAISGASLINGTDFTKLTTETNSYNGTFSTVLWEDSGDELELKSGMLLGLIESRGDVTGGKGSTSNGSPVESGTTAEDVDNDADTYNFTGTSKNTIPDLKTGINNLVSLLTRKINAIHSSGEGLDGSTGVDFFVKINENLPFEAGNIQINPELDDTDKIAASSIGSDNDGAIAEEIYNFAESEYFQADGLKMNIDDYYSNLIQWVGTQGDEAEGFVTNQKTLIQEISNKKDSLSSVSMDEELSNLVKYQHAYNASARVLNTIDSMMETLISNMGIVGR